MVYKKAIINKKREKMVKVMKKVSEKYEENVKVARKEFPKALVLDLTMEGAMKRMDPAFPLGKVEIPGMMGKGLSLKGVWEGLKVFRNKEEIDEKWMNDERKLGKERGCKSWGKLEGLKIGNEVIGEEEGKKIFRKMYEEMLKERFEAVLEGIRREAKKRTVVLLDYREEVERPFNHVEVVKEMLMD